MPFLDFASALKRHRLAAGLSQEQLAERAGLSARGVSALETGARTAPYRDTVIRLAEALALGEGERRAFLAGVQRARQGTGHAAHDDGSDLRAALPNPPTSLLGRDREVDSLVSLLGATNGARLITLVGTGGVGKTRLAIATAHAVAERFSRARFVEFAPVAGGSFLPALKASLGVYDDGEPLPGLVRELAVKRQLLVLDNLEHLVADAAPLATLLSACAELSILVTSRQPLHLSGERIVDVVPLAQRDAFDLFLARVRAVDARFDAQVDVDRVERIIERLDGLPLAIEIAAARMRHSTAASLLSGLDDRLAMLTGGSRDLPRRQRTMRDTIAWSYDLLDERERAVLHAVATFDGGCTTDALAAVCDQRLQRDVEEAVRSLADKSLLTVRNDGDRRATMLETIREYVRERSSQAGDRERLARAHAAYFAAFAEATELTGSEQKAAAAALDREDANLHAALRTLRDGGDFVEALLLAGGLVRFWHQRGRLEEGRAWIESLLASVGERDDRKALTARARANHGLAWLAFRLGDRETAAAAAEASMTLAHAAGDVAGQIAARNALAHDAALDDDLDGAAELYAENLKAAREFGTKRDVVLNLSNLALVLIDLRRIGEARSLLEDSLALLESELEDDAILNTTLLALATVTRIEREFERSRRYDERALAVSRELGNRVGVAAALVELGRLDAESGDQAAAARHFIESLDESYAIDWLANVAESIEGIAIVAAAAHHWEACALLTSASVKLRVSSAIHLAWHDRQARDGAAVAAHAALGEERFEATWNRGQDLSLEAAVAEAKRFAETQSKLGD